MTRTLIWGFQYDVGEKILTELKKNFNVVFTINNHNGNNLNLQKICSGYLDDNYTINHTSLNDFENFRNKYFYTFQIMMTSRNANDRNVNETMNEFVILYYYFSSLIREK